MRYSGPCSKDIWRLQILITSHMDFFNDAFIVLWIRAAQKFYIKSLAFHRQIVWGGDNIRVGDELLI